MESVKYSGIFEGIKQYEEAFKDTTATLSNMNLSENIHLKNEYFCSSIKVASLYYSNDNLGKLNEQYNECFRYLDSNYSPLQKYPDSYFKKSKIYHQYFFSSYDIMLWALSLGYLLNISKEKYQKLLDILEYDRITDKLYEFIISAKIIGRKTVEDSCEPNNEIIKIYEPLRSIITAKSEDAQQQMRYYVEEGWMRQHAKYKQWPGLIKKQERQYYPYWSFESAAIVKIMGLNDNEFKNAPFYPGKLVVMD